MGSRRRKALAARARAARLALNGRFLSHSINLPHRKLIFYDLSVVILAKKRRVSLFFASLEDVRTRD